MIQGERSLITGRWISPEERELERLARMSDPEFVASLKQREQWSNLSLVISDKGNAIKAELDDPTNPKVLDVGIQDTPVAGDMGQQTTTNNPISEVIGGTMDVFSGVINTIGGIFQ